MRWIDLFQTNPRRRIEREIRSKSAKAMQMQRNGKLQQYAALTAEVELLERELEQLVQVR